MKLGKKGERERIPLATYNERKAVTVGSTSSAGENSLKLEDTLKLLWKQIILATNTKS